MANQKDKFTSGAFKVKTKDGRWVTMDEYMKNGGNAAKSTKKSTPKKKK